VPAPTCSAHMAVGGGKQTVAFALRLYFVNSGDKWSAAGGLSQSSLEKHFNRCRVEHIGRQMEEEQQMAAVEGDEEVVDWPTPTLMTTAATSLGLGWASAYVPRAARGCAGRASQQALKCHCPTKCTRQTRAATPLSAPRSGTRIRETLAPVALCQPRGRCADVLAMRAGRQRAPLQLPRASNLTAGALSFPSLAVVYGSGFRFYG
jgi:hypothetical protein